ncbi:unnamed protein product, partial [Ixodes pacificus]
DVAANLDNVSRCFHAHHQRRPEVPGDVDSLAHVIVGEIHPARSDPHPHVGISELVVVGNDRSFSNRHLVETSESSQDHLGGSRIFRSLFHATRVECLTAHQAARQPDWQASRNTRVIDRTKHAIVVIGAAA